MIFKNSKATLISLSILAFIMIFLLLLDFWHIRSKNKETALILSQAEAAGKEETLIQSVRLLQNTSQGDFEAFEDIVLSDSKLIPVIESIEGAARALLLETEIVSVDKEESNSAGPQKIRIVIESDGTWRGTFSFLKAIENLPHRVMLEKSSFDRKGNGWHSTVTLTFYSFN